MTRHTYGVLAIAQRHAELFSTMTKPRAPDALRHFTDAQRHERALFEMRMRAGRVEALPSCFGTAS